MNAEQLVTRLDGVKSTGHNRWIAKCSSHEDKTASLAIREVDDGRVLLHCFAGCGVGEVLGGLGLSMSDLFPEPLGDRFNPVRKRWSHREICEIGGASMSNFAFLVKRMQNQKLTDEEMGILLNESQILITLFHEATNG
jgi:hypothetical protein